MLRLPRIFVLLALACAPSLNALAADASEATHKVALMADALRARDDGDYATARQRLLDLLQLNPDDPAARRLLLSVNEKLDAQPAPQPRPAAPQAAADIDMAEVRQLADAESLRLQGSADFVRETVKRADRLADEGRGVEAVALVDAALAGPPLPPAQEQDLRAARARLAGQPMTEDPGTQAVARNPRRPRPPTPTASPAPAEASSPDADFQHQVLSGKAQLLAGDPAGAQEAFLAALAEKPGDPTTLRLLEQASLRLREQREGDRMQARGKMLRDVDKAWAPRPFVTLPEEAAAAGDHPSPVIARLKEVQVPKVSFDALPLSKALETLSALAEQQGHPVNLLAANPGADDPPVTLTLRDLPLDRVLHYVAERVGYDLQADNDAIILRPSPTPGRSLYTEFFPVSRSTIIRLTGNGGASDAAADPLAPPPAPEAAQVNPAEAEAALKSFLERAGVPFEEVPGATLALADGQLIVTQTPGNLDKVRAILRRYSQTKQVEIEARFLEVQEGDLNELGIQWAITNANQAQHDRVEFTGQTDNRSLARAFGGDTIEGQLVVTGLPAGVGDNGTLTQSVSPPLLTNGLDLAAGALPLARLSGLVGDFNVDAIVNALARRSGNDLMSAPKLTVLSGKRAEIVVAQEMIYPRSYGDINASVGRGSALEAGGTGVAVTTGTPRDFVTRNVGVEMSVTPTVEADDSVSLLLEPRVTEFEGFMQYGGPSVAISGSTTVTVPSGFYQPVFSVRRVKTEVTLWDGATVIMGGLTREQAVTVKDKVPVLGDIPLLGRLFRSEGSSTQKKNLLIFVTAKLVNPGGGKVRE